MPKGIPVRLCDVEIRLGEAWTRMPFRYGNACLTAVPVALVRATLEGPSGALARGLASDCLPPRWFDKDPSKDFRRNVDDQIAAIRLARAAWLETSSVARTLYALWREAYPATLARGVAAGLNKLTAGFGCSLIERAAIDAACRLQGASFHDALRSGALGLDVGSEIAPRPLDAIDVRHTVGLGDAIRADEIPAAERLDDGLPQALEEAIDAYGLRWFKVKVNGQQELDRDRLDRIARLLAERCPDGYSISLDGNEQYRDLGLLDELLADLQREAPGRRFVESIVFIEQPLAREVALSPEHGSAIERLGALRPVIIDESDDDLDALPRAIEVGYRGCSSKNCKGVFKALAFKRIMHEHNERHPQTQLFQTGEDLANTPIVPLQQDLATLATLGVTHAERNGYHYFRGLEHLPAAERASAAAAHPDLYAEREGLIALRIDAGRLALGSLHRPGYGYSCDVAFEERAPLEEWRFERLALS